MGFVCPAVWLLFARLTNTNYHLQWVVWPSLHEWVRPAYSPGRPMGMGTVSLDTF